MDRLKTEPVEQSQSNKGKTVWLVTLTGISLLFYYLFKGTESRLEQLFVLILYAFSVIPITLSIMFSYCMGKLNSGLKVDNKNKPYKKPDAYAKKDKIANIAKDNVTNIKDHSNKTNKPRKVNDSPNYESCRETITICSQQRLFSVEDVFELDQLIDSLLGEHSKVYNSFNYNNDFQKIYTKLKSKKLVEKDYEFILEWCSKIAKESVI